MASRRTGLNGDPTALVIDRAIGELRRGRAIELTGEDSPLMVTAVETLRLPIFERLRRQAGDAARLVVTAERATALAISVDPRSAVSIALGRDWGLEELRTVAGALPLGTQPSPLLAPEIATPAMRAALQLAKAGRLVPALLVSRRSGAEDPSLLSLPAENVAPYTTFARYTLRRTSQARVPLAEAVDCEIALFRDEHALGEHVAVIIGSPDPRTAVPVRLHSACFTGDLLNSLRCDCGEQLRTAVARIANLGGGVLLYLDQEGRGIGLPNKLRAYALQDAGLDTLDADRHLGFLSDERTYDVAAVLLRELGISRISLLTNNPQKIAALREHGIEVAGRVSLVATTNSHNERYIKAKRERAGHLAEESGG